MKKIEIFRYSLATVIVIGFFVLMYVLISHAIPEQNDGILKIVIGALIGSFTGVVGYFFGSSSGSKEKTELLANGKKIGDNPPPKLEEPHNPEKAYYRNDKCSYNKSNYKCIVDTILPGPLNYEEWELI